MDYKNYQDMRNSGRTALDAYIAAFNDGKLADYQLPMLESVFELSREDAIEVMRHGDEVLFEDYVQLKTHGSTPETIYRLAKSNGLNPLTRIRLLRYLFGFSVAEAKAIKHRIES
jgi:hypothetical protein